MDSAYKENLRARFFRWWGGLCHDHAYTVIAIVLVITAFFSYFAATIEINLGFLSLLEEDDPVVIRVNDANKNFGGLDYLNIGLTTPADQPVDREKLIRYANVLTKKLRADKELISRVWLRVDYGAMLRWAPLFLEDEDLDRFIADTTERQDDLQKIFTDVRITPFLTQMNGMLEREILEEEEITNERETLDQLDAIGAFFETAWDYMQKGENMEGGPARRSLRKLFLPATDEDVPDDDYFFFDNGRMLLLRMMPSMPADDYIYCDKVLDLVHRSVAETDKIEPGVGVLLAGNMNVMTDEHQAMVHDMKFTTILSMVLVLIIFIVVFRKMTDLILIAVCLMCGLGITFGITEFVIGYLSLLTAFFGAIMIGLGIDFAIHFIARYGEFIRNGHGVRDSIIGSMVGAGPGMLTGGATTASAFLVLMIARFKGLSELGFVSGVGILVMLVLMFSLLPAMVALRDRKKVPAELVARSISDMLPLGRAADLTVKHPVIGLLVFVLVIAASVYGALHTSFNYDFRSLEPVGAQSIKDINEMERRVGKSMDYSLYIVDDIETGRQYAKQAKELSTVRDSEAISDFIPEHQDVAAKKLKKLAPVLGSIHIDKWPGQGETMSVDDIKEYAKAVRGSARITKAILQLAILGGQFDVEDRAREVEKRILAVAEKIESQVSDRMVAGATAYQRHIGDELAHVLGSLKQSTAGELLTPDKLPEAVRKSFIGKDGRFAVYVYPTRNIWHELFMKEHNAQVRSISNEAVSLGILFETVVNNIKIDFMSSVWFSLAAVFLLVLIDFRSLKTALLALIPLLTGSAMMVGIMPLIGMQFNLVNVSIVPLILGIGIDNGVHILHRYRMETENRIHNAVEHTGKAILLSSLTTMAGFGMLGLATYVAIGTLGQLLVVGVGFCFLTSVLVLPLVLGWINRKPRAKKAAVESTGAVSIENP